MDSIDIDWRALSAYVEECAKHADIHTVTVTLNGQHGGADVIIEGFGRTADPIGGTLKPYKREYEVH